MDRGVPDVISSQDLPTVRKDYVFVVGIALDYSVLWLLAAQNSAQDRKANLHLQRHSNPYGHGLKQAAGGSPALVKGGIGPSPSVPVGISTAWCGFSTSRISSQKVGREGGGADPLRIPRLDHVTQLQMLEKTKKKNKNKSMSIFIQATRSTYHPFTEQLKNVLLT